jgi:hypothetical protein
MQNLVHRTYDVLARRPIEKGPQHRAMKDQLSLLMAADGDQFCGVWKAMDKVTRVRLLVGNGSCKFARTLLQKSLQKDLAQIFLMIRADARHLELSDVMLPLPITEAVTRLHHLAMQFRDGRIEGAIGPRLATLMVEDHRLSAVACARRGLASSGSLVHWLATKRLTFADYRTVTNCTLQDAAKLVDQNFLQGADLALCWQGDPEAKPVVANFVMQGKVPAARYVEAFSPSEDEAFALTRSGMLSTRKFLQANPRPSGIHMRDLVELGYATHAQWLLSNTMPSQKIEEQIDTGHWTAATCMELGPLPDDLAAKWLRRGLIDADLLFLTGQAHWRAEDPLRHVDLIWASQQTSPESLLRLPMPGLPGSAVRRSYAVRMLAAHLLPMPSLSPLPKPKNALATALHYAAQGAWNVWQTACRVMAMSEPPMDAAAAPPTGVPGVPTPHCSVCVEPLTEATFAVTLAACNHPATMGIDCFQQAIAVGHFQSCPYPNCNEPIRSNDVLALKMGSALADRFAMQQSRQVLSTRPGWQACPAEGCIGGATLGAKLPSILHDCTVCGTQSVLRFVSEAVTDDNRAHLKRLISGVGTTADGDNERPMRECYHCGTQTIHQEGCNAMLCTCCHRRWHFRHGPVNDHDFEAVHQEQTYVPHAGLMLRVGLYAGLEPGATDVRNLSSAVATNARRLGL